MLFKKVFRSIYFRSIYTKVFDLKYVKTTGVKGIRNRKFKEDVENEEDFENESKLDLEDIEYDTIAESVFQVSRSNIVEQRVLVIQPFVKWGPNKKATKPELQIQEAESLIHSIQNWEVKESLKVPLESLGKKALFGKGKMEELKSIIKSHNSKGKPITSVFVSIGVLSFAQRQNLTNELKLLILDRYSVVIQILRLHAISTESKIQVALAEIPYIWNHLKAANTNISTQMYHLSDGQKQILRSRERKLRNELEKVRNHRKLLRKKRQQKDIPLVSVVGYTNAGKTSLIKALTNSSTLQPRNQLFATLDVTAHAGLLPSNLQIIYMDTVGFMSDLPTGLIECFVATLEDVLLSDLIIHVQDVSHENVEEQRNHVEITLKNLFHSLDKNEKIPPILNVGNKIDLVSNYSGGDLKLISSKTSVGQNDLLEAIEEKILENTNRQKKILRVRNGGPEIAWLYKNAAVTSVVADQKDSNYLLVKIVISDTSMFKFKKEFLRN